MSSRQPSVLWPLLALVALLVAALATSAIVDWVPWSSPFKGHLATRTLQFIVLTLAGGVLAAWWAGRGNKPIVTVSPHAMWLAPLVGVAAYVGGRCCLSLFRHQALLSGLGGLV